MKKMIWRSPLKSIVLSAGMTMSKKVIDCPYKDCPLWKYRLEELKNSKNKNLWNLYVKLLRIIYTDKLSNKRIRQRMIKNQDKNIKKTLNY